MSDIYEQVKEIYKEIYKQKDFSENTTDTLQEGIDILSRITPIDIILAYKLGITLSERINLWKVELEKQLQINELNNKGKEALKILTEMSLNIFEIMDKLFNLNGGREIEKGRELIQSSVSEQGLPINEKEIEIISGINLMILGLNKLGEIDLYGAQVNAQALKFFIEGVMFNHGSEAIKTVWLGHKTTLNNLITISLINFYPDLTSN
jgi:hypothetical protein